MVKTYEVTVFVSCDEDVREDYVKNAFERFIRQVDKFDNGGVSVCEVSDE